MKRADLVVGQRLYCDTNRYGRGKPVTVLAVEPHERDKYGSRRQIRQVDSGTGVKVNGTAMYGGEFEDVVQLRHLLGDYDTVNAEKDAEHEREMAHYRQQRQSQQAAHAAQAAVVARLKAAGLRDVDTQGWGGVVLTTADAVQFADYLDGEAAERRRIIAAAHADPHMSLADYVADMPGVAK